MQQTTFYKAMPYFAAFQCLNTIVLEPMHRPDCIICSFIENSIGLKMVRKVTGYTKISGSLAASTLSVNYT